MNISFTKTAHRHCACWLAGIATLIAAGSASSAPSTANDTAPPLRTGLWQQNHSQTLNGVEFDVPGFVVDQARESGVDVSDDGTSERLCITPQNMASLGQPSASMLPACRQQNVRLTSKGLSLKLVCEDETGAGEGSVNVIFDSPTYYHGTFEFNGTHQLFGDNMLPLQVSGKVTGRWMTPSCASRRH